MIKIDNVLFVSLGGVLGYLIRGFVEHYLAKSRAREDRNAQMYMNAVEIFRQTLITELSGLHPVVTEAVNLIGPRLAKAVPQIQIAVSRFSFNLSKQEATKLQSSFNSFRDAAENEIPRLCSPAERMYGKETLPKALALLRERIDELLAHAV